MKQKFLGTRRRKVATIAVAALLVAAAAAFAAWVIGGSGPARAKGGTATDLTISAADPAQQAELYPYSEAAPAYQASNDNQFPVQIQTEQVVGPVTSNEPSCAAAVTILNGAAAPVAETRILDPGETATFNAEDARLSAADLPAVCEGNDVYYEVGVIVTASSVAP